MEPQMQMQAQVKRQEARVEPRLESVAESASSPAAASGGGVKNLAIAGAALSLMVLAAALLNQPSDEDNFVEGTQISVGQTELDQASLINHGVGQSFLLRDFAMQDGDMVSINGGAPIMLSATPVAMNLSPGALWLTFKNGTNGCVSVEIIDALGPRKLCVADGVTVATYVDQRK